MWWSPEHSLHQWKCSPAINYFRVWLHWDQWTQTAYCLNDAAGGIACGTGCNIHITAASSFSLSDFLLWFIIAASKVEVWITHLPLRFLKGLETICALICQMRKSFLLETVAFMDSCSLQTPSLGRVYNVFPCWSVQGLSENNTLPRSLLPSLKVQEKKFYGRGASDTVACQKETPVLDAAF